MRTGWFVYLVVGVISIAVGIAIAGLPENAPVDATITVPATTGPTLVTLPPPTGATPTDLPSTTTSTLPPRATSTLTTATSAPVSSTTVPNAATTAAPTTASAPTTAGRTSVPVADRSAVVVVVANGADIPQLATDTAGALEETGYRDVIIADGTRLVSVSAVYAVPGREREAARLADDLELDDRRPRPLADAPEVEGSIGGTEILAYLGQDRG